MEISTIVQRSVSQSVPRVSDPFRVSQCRPSLPVSGSNYFFAKSPVVRPTPCCLDDDDDDCPTPPYVPANLRDGLCDDAILVDLQGPVKNKSAVVGATTTRVMAVGKSEREALPHKKVVPLLTKAVQQGKVKTTKVKEAPIQKKKNPRPPTDVGMYGHVQQRQRRQYFDNFLAIL